MPLSAGKPGLRGRFCVCECVRGLVVVRGAERGAALGAGAGERIGLPAAGQGVQPSVILGAGDMFDAGAHNCRAGQCESALQLTQSDQTHTGKSTIVLFSSRVEGLG